MPDTYNHEAYLSILAKRKERKKQFVPSTTALREIRLYFTYDIPNTLFYLFNYTKVITRILIQKNFCCPGYSHINISIGENEKEAIARAYELEDWYRFGIAVLPKDKFFNCPDKEKEDLILQTITEGLLDIATLDHLDKKILKEAIEQAKQWGVMHERIIREKQNKKFCFRISSMPIRNSAEENIFFTLIDRDGVKEYKWKFGQLHILDAIVWFFKITVTNKVIRTKPAARTDIILKGRKKEFEISVEDIKKEKGKVKLEDTVIPIEPWIIELEEKLKTAPKNKNS
ncbi:MAG TPA: hypothetical protein VFU29_23380 [Chitinophagaceae bacterium]|nr:hypothetical protein [Chitinophagaceae bacterium]